MNVTADEALKLAVTFHQAGDLHKAEQYYQAIIKAVPEHPDANNNIGVIFQQHGKLNEAAACFKVSIKANPSIDQYWVNYSNVLVQLGEVTKIPDIILSATRNNASPNAIKKMAKILSNDRSQSDFGRMHPGETKLQELRKNLIAQNFDAAIFDAKRQLNKFPKSHILFNFLGVAYQSVGNIEDAINAFECVTALKPSAAEGFYNLGLALQKNGKLDEAVINYHKATKLDSSYSEAYYNLGLIYQAINDFSLALEAYENAILTDPDFSDAHYNKGILLTDTCQLEEALDAYDKALSSRSDFTEAYHNAAELLKMYSPIKTKMHKLFALDTEIKSLCAALQKSHTGEEIAVTLDKAFTLIDESKATYKTPLTQIYRHNSIDMNCKRHMSIFDTQDIIPEYCFSCFKVQVEVEYLIDLVKLTAIIYNFEGLNGLTAKTLVETRPSVPGFYKAIVYCNSIEEVQFVKISLQRFLKNKFKRNVTINVKRGCSEFPVKIPRYGILDQQNPKFLTYPKDWEKIEFKYDAANIHKLEHKPKETLRSFCLSDLHVVQRWVDYAKGLGDPSVQIFNYRKLLFREDYDIARWRANNFNKSFH
jgi:tetratricopeptide (TPR) repeat protein